MAKGRGGYRPINYSIPSGRTNSSRSSVGDTFTRSYAEALDLVEQLSSHQTLNSNDSSIAGRLERFKSLYISLGAEEQRNINEFLKKTQCTSIDQVRPGTVGAYLCGCFLRASAYGGQNPGCAVSCVGNPLSEPEQNCGDTVMLWTANAAGEPTFKILNRGNGNCRINVDPSFPNITSEKRQEFLGVAGCQTVNMFNAVTNAPIGQTPTYTMPASTVAPMPVAQVYSQPIANTPTSAAAVPATTTGFGWVAWVFALFFLFLIIGVIVYVWCRE